MADKWENICNDFRIFTNIQCQVELKRNMGSLNTWSATASGSGGYRKVIVPMVNEDMLNKLFLSAIPPNCISALSTDNLKAIFNDFDSLESFLQKGQFILNNFDSLDGQISQVFVCPYVYASRSFGLTEFQGFKQYFRAHKWKPLFFSTVVETNFRKYNHAGTILMFVRKTVDGEIDGTKWKFYNVVLPNSKGVNTVSIGNGSHQIELFGEEGWVPNTFVGFGETNNPYIYHRTGAANMQNVTFAFHPFQVVGKKLQWNVSSGDPEIATRGISEQLKIPSHFQIENVGPSNEQISNGFLKGKTIMFNSPEGWELMKVISVINPKKRSKSRPFQYVVCFEKDGAERSVQFLEEKYGFSGHLPVSSWCILNQVKVAAPEGFELLEKCGEDQNGVDNGVLQNSHIMFKFSETEWAEGLLERLIPLNERTKTKPYQYVLKWADTNESLKVWLDVNKYTSRCDSHISSWCLLKVE